MSTVEDLVRVPVSFRSSGRSLRAEFEAAAPDLSDLDALRGAVYASLLAAPDLVDAWQTYSFDKRSSPGPYLDGDEVGFFDRNREDVVRHGDTVAACADFICREAAWVLQGLRI